MAQWKEVSKQQFDEHIEAIEAEGEKVYSRYYKRDDIIVYYTGAGNPMDQQWIAKVHGINEDKKRYYTAPMPEQP
jgi:hypothetical protein